MLLSIKQKGVIRLQNGGYTISVNRNSVPFGRRRKCPSMVFADHCSNGYFDWEKNHSNNGRDREQRAKAACSKTKGIENNKILLNKYFLLKNDKKHLKNRKSYGIVSATKIKESVQ